MKEKEKKDKKKEEGKQNMKKFLSALLAFCLIAVMIPAATVRITAETLYFFIALLLLPYRVYVPSATRLIIR